MNMIELEAKVNEAIATMRRETYVNASKTYKFSYSLDELSDAYDKSLGNAASILSDKNQRCACFACKRIFPSSAIRDGDIYDDSDCISLQESDCQQTVFCPYCGTDSVVCDKDVGITDELINDLNVLGGLQLVAKFRNNA